MPSRKTADAGKPAPRSATVRQTFHVPPGRDRACEEDAEGDDAALSAIGVQATLMAIERTPGSHCSDSV
jgi:hypothetical protein